MKKLLLALMVMAALALSGCSGKQVGTPIDGSPESRIVFVEDLGGQHYIVADKKTGYEYYATRSYNNAYVIGGSVLDENGKPVKVK